MGIPIPYRWTGEEFKPLPRFAKEADREFVVGETYKLVEQQDRSMNSHRHYFASIHEAWINLPESEAAHHATSEHLRKFALIQCGFRDERSIVCASKAEAARIAAFVRPMDEFAVVTVSEAVVRVYTAQSQSLRAMGKADFSASKNAVLEYLSTLIGVPIGDLKNARAA